MRADHRIILGDCLDPVTGLASLPDKSVDHVITDPPYEAEAHTAGRRIKTTGGGGNYGTTIVCAHAPGRSRWNGGGKRGVYNSARASTIERRPALHMTEKPLPVIEALVRDFTDEGETVLDPFAGSGTTGVAAKRLGRKFIGWERDPKYHAIAEKRIAGAREQLRFFEGAGT